MNTLSENDADCIITESIKHPLNYVNVNVSLPDTPGVSVEAVALDDSGSECALISQTVLQHIEQTDPVVPIGEVKISGICGDSVVCPLVRLRMCPKDVEGGVVITAAVMSTLSDDLVLPSTIVRCLHEMSTTLEVNVVTRSQTCENRDEVENSNVS